MGPRKELSVKKKCDTCRFVLRRKDYSRFRKKEYRCTNPLSDCFEGVVVPDGSCDKWKSMKKEDVSPLFINSRLKGGTKSEEIL